MRTGQYNIYTQMLRAAAGDPPSGSPTPEEQAAQSANAPTINMDDDDDASQLPGAGGGEDGDLPVVTASDPPVEADDPPATKPPAMVPRDAMLDRISTLSKKNQEKDRALAEANARLAALQAAQAAGGDPPADPPAAVPPAPGTSDFERAVQAEAARRAAADRFNEKCNAIADAGTKAYGDAFEDSLANLRALSDDGQIPMTLLNAAMASDDPSKVLHELGADLKEAQRVLSLSPVEQIAVAVKRGIKQAAVAPAPKPRPKVPAPIDPISGDGGGGDEGLGDNVDSETWLRNREKQLKEKQERQMGMRR